MDATAVIERVREKRGGEGGALEGVELASDTVRPRSPTDAKYGGVRINVVRLRVTDRRAYDPTRTAVALLVALRSLYPDSLRFESAKFDQLAGGPDLRKAVLDGQPGSVVWQAWDAALARFGTARRKALLY
jgi:uncharacterized protein YbbC (DUF1343 family)